MIAFRMNRWVILAGMIGGMLVAFGSFVLFSGVKVESPSVAPLARALRRQMPNIETLRVWAIAALMYCGLVVVSIYVYYQSFSPSRERKKD